MFFSLSHYAIITEKVKNITETGRGKNLNCSEELVEDDD
jgi:hypothetical protein